MHVNRSTYIPTCTTRNFILSVTDGAVNTDSCGLSEESLSPALCHVEML